MRTCSQWFEHRARQLLLLLFTVAGCGLTTPRSCTDIGCASGLIVDLNVPAASTPVTVLATATDGSTKSDSCVPTTGSCSVFLNDFTASNATIKVSGDSYTSTNTLQITYQSTRPNGPDCPPICLNARISFTITQPTAATQQAFAAGGRAI